MSLRTIAGIACGLATMGGTLLVSATNAHAATDLGGISVAAYCARNVYSGNPFAASQAVNINNKWDGWRCAKINGELIGVDMNKACRQQYQSDAWANHTSTRAYSWRCYR